MKIWCLPNGVIVSQYSIMITVGVIIAVAAGALLVKKCQCNMNSYFCLFIYVFLFGLLGAKILYLFVMRQYIEWSRMTDFAYFKEVMMGGFVFYGGLIFGVLAVFLASHIHKIRPLPYLIIGMSCLPIAHGFGRIGCCLAGCCYGIPYDGPGAVIYHESEVAMLTPVEVPLFPVQLLEALILFTIAVLLIVRIYRKGLQFNNISLYLILYGTSRFFLEYLRYDHAERGGFWFFSTSQWISIILILIGVFLRKIKVPESFLRDRTAGEGKDT